MDAIGTDANKKYENYLYDAANKKDIDKNQKSYSNTFFFAAWSRGIGSCCLGSSARWILDSPSAKPYLDRMAFSKNYKLLYCIALGYPDESPEAKPRRQDMIKFMD